MGVNIVFTEMMYPPQMTPEVIQAWPGLIPGSALINHTMVSLRVQHQIRMLSLHMPLEVIVCTVPYGPGTSLNFANKRLLVPQIMFPTLLSTFHLPSFGTLTLILNLS
jgi:hypothetical protein